jgi:hypothetical protein
VNRAAAKGGIVVKASKTTIEVRGSSIAVLSRKDDDYISLTDIARVKSVEHTDDLIRNWLRNRNTVEFLGVWERLNNPGSNPVEFDVIRMKGALTASLSPRSSGGCGTLPIFPSDVKAPQASFIVLSYVVDSLRR